MISVVIPTYNNRTTITAAIESVRMQNFKDLEIIVVDDGSDDDTQEVLKSYADNGIIRCFKKSNGGCASARNFGIREARGEIVAFLDGDDEWLEGHLEKKYSLLVGGGFDWVAGGFNKRFPDGRLEYRTITSCPNVLWDKATCQFKLLENGVYWFSSHPIGMITVLFKKDALLSINLFDESFKTSEDWDLYLKAEEAGLRSGYDDTPSAIYSYNPTSITKSKKHDCVRDQLLLARKHSLILGLDRAEIRKSYADFVWHAGRTYFSGKERVKSATCFLHSLILDFDLKKVLNPFISRFRSTSL